MEIVVAEKRDGAKVGQMVYTWVDWTAGLKASFGAVERRAD